MTLVGCVKYLQTIDISGTEIDETRLFLGIIGIGLLLRSRRIR